MTIGIPKIPMNPPGAQKTVWVEIDEALCRGRVLMLFGEIDRNLATEFISLILFLGTEYDDIFIFINSSGGNIRSGITLYDTITMIPDVYTLVLGLAASVASLILSGGTYKERVAFPHSRVIISQPIISRFSGSSEILVSEAKEILRLRSVVADIYAKNTGKPVSVIQQDLETKKVLSATEAKEYGIIDKVAREVYSKMC